MRLRRTVTAAAVLGLAASLAAPAAASAAPAPATKTKLGTTSLASVLTSDGNRFDCDWYDYDIVTEAVLAVLAANPDSPVGLLADGTVPLTAFIPNDRAFQVLVKDLTGKWLPTERRTFNTLARVAGLDVIEDVLLYHVVPGATITSKQAVNADGVALQTALPDATFTVDVISKRIPIIRLKDNDPNDISPFVNPWALDINKGNKQIAHGIVFVLRPIDL